MRGSEPAAGMSHLLIWYVDTKDEHFILELLPIVTQGALEEMYAGIYRLSLKSIRTLINKSSLDIDRNRLIFMIHCTKLNIQSSLLHAAHLKKCMSEYIACL